MVGLDGSFLCIALIKMSLSHPDFNGQCNSERTVTVSSKRMNTDILRDAELIDPLGGARLQLRFTGPFEGDTVTWNAIFITLSASTESPAPQRNFIEIGDESEHGLTLTVGLNVPCIDAPTVRKAMMMIRQYKRLARGRHEYGPAHR